MNLLISILAGIFILFGLGLIFSPSRRSGMAGVICIGSGVFTYDDKSLMPLTIGFDLLWVLRLSDFEDH